MIKHILKIAWNERKINILLVVEYFLIFCILWFVGEFMYITVANHIESTGMNIEHTYRINMQRMDALEGKQVKYGKDDHYRFVSTFEDRLKRYPGIESVGFSTRTAPYGTNQNNTAYRDAADSLYFRIGEGDANSGFFRVFKIQVTGNMSNWDEEGEDNKAILASPRDGKPLGNRPIADVRSILKRGREDHPKSIFKVVGYTPTLKLNDVDRYNGNNSYIISHRFRPLFTRDVVLDDSEISIRVRPEADVNFVEKFTRDMSEQLKVGDYYMASIVSYKDMRKNLHKMWGITEQMNMRFAVMGFLLVNIFLGILGSFWFRTQARRSEIGLRMAIGSSKVKVKWHMVTEGIALLAIASVAATVVCFYLQKTQLPQLIGSNTTGRIALEYDPSTNFGYTITKLGVVAQDFINFGLAFGLLALITFVAVWYPAKQAADTQPAETLHEE